MSFEEQIEKLTERHEALVQYLDSSSHGWNERYEKQSKQIDDLTAAFKQTASSIDALARIAELHEHRLDRLEG
jgi:methyl-accepting chemotaxis protein